MDLSCENKTRLVEFKNGSLVITLIDCKKCERCQPKPIEVVDLVESDVESDTDYSPYTRCLLYTSPSPRDMWTSRMPSSA